MGALLGVDDGLVHRHFERERLLHRHQNMLDDLKRHLLYFRHVYSSLHRVRHRLLHRNRDLFYDWYDDGLRYGHLDWYGMRHRYQYGLVDLELDVLRHRYDDLLVVLDRLRVLLLDVLVHRVRVGLQVVAAKVVATETVAAEVLTQTAVVTQRADSVTAEIEARMLARLDLFE